MVTNGNGNQFPIGMATNGGVCSGITVMENTVIEITVMENVVREGFTAKVR